MSQDIAHLLAHTWAMQPGEGISHEAIPRRWTYDMNWFDMDTANTVRDRLVETGWLESAGDGLHPGIDLTGITPPFGWMPIMRTLLSPPPCPGKTVQPKPTPEPKVAAPVEESAPLDPAAANIEPLLLEIVKTSGLARKEVMRRASRKRRALGPVTLWMAMLLVAREQQLEMAPLLEQLQD